MSGRMALAVAWISFTSPAVHMEAENCVVVIWEGRQRMNSCRQRGSSMHERCTHQHVGLPCLHLVRHFFLAFNCSVHKALVSQS